MAGEETLQKFCMKNFSSLVTLAFAVLVGTAGCGRKTDASSELQRAVEAVSPKASAPPTQTSTPTPASQLDQALNSFKGGNYNDAVTQLHTVIVEGSNGKLPMTPQQFMAVQDASRSVLGELSIRAVKGDAKAQQAINEYERLNH